MKKKLFIAIVTLTLIVSASIGWAEGNKPETAFDDSWQPADSEPLEGPEEEDGDLSGLLESAAKAAGVGDPENINEISNAVSGSTGALCAEGLELLRVTMLSQNYSPAEEAARGSVPGAPSEGPQNGAPVSDNSVTAAPLAPEDPADPAAVSDVPRDRSFDPQEEEPDLPPTDGELAEAVIAEGRKYLGTPYIFGGKTPKGFDCSGYVMYVLHQCGYEFTAACCQDLYNLSERVSKENLKRGDLVFFSGTYSTSAVSHVGIYLGDGTMIHAGTKNVCITDLSYAYWRTHFTGYGRMSSYYQP